MAPSHSHQNLWFPGFLERMACCALPPQNINDVVLVGDDQEDDSSSGIVSGDDPDETVVVLESNTRQPVSQQPLPSRQQPRSSDANTTTHLPSPTFTPSRRELDRWDTSWNGVTAWCTPSCAGSTATTATTMSEEGGYYGRCDTTEEIRSNATTLVVSHKNRNNRTHELLSSTLASAEKRLRKQLLEEEARAEYLKARRQREGPR
jgi:hypothetical protein